MTSNDLLDKVISQIKRDILDQEVMALELLLSEVSDAKLKAYLPEAEESIAD